jgi:hypothetical protein
VDAVEVKHEVVLNFLSMGPDHIHLHHGG